MEKENEKSGFEYANVYQKKVEPGTLAEKLPEIFEEIFAQVQPVIQKMIDENSMKAIHGFGHYVTEQSVFHLDIWGEALPDEQEIDLAPDAPPQDFEHFADNMRERNDHLIKTIFDEMLRQNVTEQRAGFQAYSKIGIFEQKYLLTLCWKCTPQEKRIITPSDARRINFKNN